ncbi:MAG: antibiotic biosynthesis monooxygenase [Candidatus Lokiarchaeota archaeon]|nr:antibiotic biosynthesis monooxygenase [Candidatus Lokiarchaeota archaeon]
MVTIIATVEVKDGKMEEAIKVLKEIVPKIKSSESGTLEYIPHTIKGGKFKNTIIFYEKYENEEAFKTHMGNLAKTAADLTPLMKPGMDLKTCFEIV